MSTALIVAAIPRSLRQRRAWMVWRYEPSPGNPEKITKVPYSVHGGKASSTDPSTWATFREAVEYYLDNGGTDGIGMAVCDEDDFVGIDLDHCVDADSGTVARWAQEIVATIDSYTEVTPSGTGLRIFARGSLPATGRKRGDFEVYATGRYLTVTGQHLDGTPRTVETRESEIRRVHRLIWPDPIREQPAERPPARPLMLPDAALLEKARGAANGQKFAALWGGNVAGYASASEADLALCNLLVFWTGADAARVDGLFRQSGLYRRKWDESHYTGGVTYGAHTIEQAIRGVQEVYSPALVGASIGRIGQNGTDEEGATVASEDRVVRALTETGNAERMVDQYGADIRFCHPWGAWLHWDGYRWKRDQTGAPRRLAKTVVRSIYTEISAAVTKEEREALYKFAVRSETSAARTAMLKLAESEPGIPVEPSDMDRDPFLLNVLNGTIELRTGQLRAHDRADIITKLAPVHFDPVASCPTFLAFLDRVVPDLEVRRFLCRMVGYGLTGDTSEQCLAFMHGAGANGKSTFLSIVKLMLGDYAKQAAPELLTSRGGDRHPTELADLFGARLVTSIEVDEGKRIAETLVKQMTGGDTVKARFMRTDFFEWMPTHKLFLAANHKPEIRGTDYAIWRRIHLIPFTVTIPEEERDAHLPEKLKTELSGILNWAIAGCLEWQQNGIGVPWAIRAATEEYRREQDVVAQFIDERCVIDAQAWVVSGTLYQVYLGWTESNGATSISTIEFGRKLGEKGFRSGRGRDGKRIWSGLRLRGAEEF